MTPITDTIKTLRDAADALERLHAEHSLDGCHITRGSATIQVPESYGTQGTRVAEVVRINDALGHGHAEYDVDANRHFGLKNRWFQISAWTPLDKVEADTSEAQQLLAQAGAA